MIGSIEWFPKLAEDVGSRQHNSVREGRVGVMIHFDASSSDRGAVQWFKDPRCNVSYQLLVLDDGSYVRIAPDNARAWHAGKCRPSADRLTYSDGNSAFYGISVATNDRIEVTAVQMLTTAFLARRYFHLNGWDPQAEVWRVVGHDTEAWPRGRKTDPTGPDPKNPILSVENIRQLLPLIRMPA